MASTCLRVSQGLIPNIRGIVRRNYLNHGSVSAVRHLSTPADEKATAPELSENEKKLVAEIESLNKDVENYKEKCSDLDDKYKRSLADTENMRKRLTKQIEDAKLFGIQGFCKDLLSVSDILQKATECVPADQVKTNSHLKNLYEGLTMTEAELQKVFKRHGLAQVSPLGEKFNPNHHEALFEQPVEGKEPGTVIAVTKIGYKLHERIVRPAMVGVAK
ncbi:grpE protein homolog, mitochondrial-like [Daphnia pulicaria]|uniref:grpE protein homolog, mitochondrial-like n=1 Tax=Daphnia pulicaria TaxID=35523 RepID=UPI001EECAD15|nr:grpE protein homolog, mitochondrial-like [Daphnia pulicaria]